MTTQFFCGSGPVTSYDCFWLLLFPHTEPPSAIIDLRVADTTDTTITITWNWPTTTGRSDFFYRVFQSDPSQPGRYILRRDNLVGQVSYQVTGLVPFTPYVLRVSVHNGVSDLDPDGAAGRVSEVTNMTGEARKFYNCIKKTLINSVSAHLAFLFILPLFL